MLTQGEGDVVFLLDVDNTLLDNDRFGADLGARLEQAFGADQRNRYWSIFAALREELSYADYLAALQKFRLGLDGNPEGVWDAVQGRVLIDVHKELALDAMRQRYPAQHYVMIDDKPRLLAAMKRALGEKLTTVFVHQGHYAAESADTVIDPPPDLEIERIGDLLDHDRADFLAASPLGIAATNQERA